jgi:hypothetical protein
MSYFDPGDDRPAYSDGLSINEIMIYNKTNYLDSMVGYPSNLFISFNKTTKWVNNARLYDNNEGARTYIEYTKCYARFPVRIEEVGWVWRKNFYVLKFVMYSGFFRFHKISDEEFSILVLKGLV